MSNQERQIKQIYVEDSIKDHYITRQILDSFEIPPIIIDTIDEIKPGVPPKQVLTLAEQKGKFIRKCPCTPNYIGCNYYVTELAVGCSFNCTYCYLQQYQNKEATVFYVNLEKLYKELDELLQEKPDFLYRIGTGEFADSIFLDNYIDYSRKLMQHLANKYDNYILEFKTKDNAINNILKSEPSGHEVISFSVNTSKIICREEKGTVDLDSRLNAALRAIDKGFFVGLHFDPIILYDGCEQDYIKVVDRIYNILDKNKIIWISLGTLRFNAKLKPIIEHYHPETKIIYDEMIKGADGKMRYLKEKRLKIYKTITDQIKKNDKDAFVYFCMEDEEVWEKVLNIKLISEQEVDSLFIKRWNIIRKYTKKIPR